MLSLRNSQKSATNKLFQTHKQYKCELDELDKQYANITKSTNYINDHITKLNVDHKYMATKNDIQQSFKKKIESMQRDALEEIKTAYSTEQIKIGAEYKDFEDKLKSTNQEKADANKLAYNKSVNIAVLQLNKLFKKYKLKINNKNLILKEFNPPNAIDIVKTCKVVPCNKLNSFNNEYSKQCIILNDEYKKSIDEMNRQADIAKSDAEWINSATQLYDNIKHLEQEYKERCQRNKYKYNIERYNHINGCTECTTTNFLYIDINKELKFIESKELTPTILYFTKYIESLKDGTTLSDIINLCNNNIDIINQLNIFIKQFIIAFLTNYNAEIDRIRELEINLPREQNIIYTTLYAEKIWTKVRCNNILNLENADKTDDAKINDFKKQDEKFYKDFPIVARYMICMDVYSRTAFKKFLHKLILSGQRRQGQVNQTPTDKKDAETEWIEMQADYVKYLYQDYNKDKHISADELNKIWRDTFNSLKREFSEFRELYTKKVKQVEEEKKKHTAKVAKDVIGRLTTIQSIDKEAELRLYRELQDTLFMQRANKNLKILLNKVQPIGDEYYGRGTNNDAEQKMQQDAKLKEAKNKIEPEAKIKNPIKYFYDNLTQENDNSVFEALADLCAIESRRAILLELNSLIVSKKIITILPVIDGNGTNEDDDKLWQTERVRWRELNPELNESEKIHIPYSRNLLRTYYYNNERFEI